MPPTTSAFILFSRAIPPRYGQRRCWRSGLMRGRRSFVANTQCIRQLTKECMILVGCILVPQGRSRIAHRFNGGQPIPKCDQAPSGERNRSAKCARVLSSLTGLLPFSLENPAINRWAIFFRPTGLPKVHAIVAQRV